MCVIDELHMIRDPDRGAALETSISKLLFSPAGRDVQVRFPVGMPVRLGDGVHVIRETAVT